MEKLEKQWQEDVKQFGELANLMWEGGVTAYNSYGDIDFSGTVQMPEGISFDNFINQMDDVWRKQSAALPFDLVAAMAGDVVEILYDHHWITVRAMHGDGVDSLIRFSQLDDNGKVIGTGLYRKSGISSEWVRMKHPRLNDAARYAEFEK
jgi:hypothetical protein